MSAFHREKVLSVRHWTDTLFSFTATRNSGFRFQNGQFAMIGLEVDGRPLMRAYSMASANHEDELEFFSIKVADGPLTSRLQRIKEGDTILVGRKATGTLVAVCSSVTGGSGGGTSSCALATDVRSENCPAASKASPTVHRPMADRLLGP